MDSLRRVNGPKTAAKAMVRLNTLFPAYSILEYEGDVEIAPYSVGLRDSIRFSVFEHIMGDSPTSSERLRAIYVKLFAWCDIPGYAQA